MNDEDKECPVCGEILIKSDGWGFEYCLKCGYDKEEGARIMNIEKDIKEEIKKAEKNFKEYNSYHEGFAVIYEEVDELWDLVKGKGHGAKEHYGEAKQIACTAIRYMKMCKRKYDS